MTTGRLDAIVLCGGESRRMGRDKASLPFGPETLVERVVRLVTPFVSDVVLAAAPGHSSTAPPSRENIATTRPHLRNNTGVMSASWRAGRRFST